LQMAGITNAGGYFLRLDQATAIVPVRLWVCVWLNGPGHDTAPLPSAANAIAYTGNTPPSVVRFEGPEHIQVTPYAPPGFLAFGWQRNVPPIATDADEFGYRTISLVDYSVKDAGGSTVLDENGRQLAADRVVALSPAGPLRGDILRDKGG